MIENTNDIEKVLKKIELVLIKNKKLLLNNFMILN